MKITDVWSMHYENFIIQIDGELNQTQILLEHLKSIFPKKKFLINNVKGGIFTNIEQNDRSNTKTN